MDSRVFTYIADAEKLVISEAETARYLGYSREGIAAAGNETLILAAIEKTRRLTAGKGCYGRYEVSYPEEGTVLLPWGEVRSRDLYRNLFPCPEIYVFAATIGAAFDRELKRLAYVSMAEAALLQAAGASAVEAVCDALNEKLERMAEAEGKRLRRRFSPGYGDLSLENQKGVFSLLTPARFIGLSLMDSLVMSPEKSVTAIIGIEDGTV
ncbi:MAG: Vitamin B12 dependent methionine synthase activation subunit [Lachnospiraceae bacterium]|nr:Vitamin B12 dependent methionine synthase activation subunit [Lachnospiraceae bacterium]